MAYYPLVGAGLGGINALLFFSALRFFSPPVAVVTAVVSGVLMTGALHLDGFADLCDGFYGSHDRKRILQIMKDPHVGGIAVVSIVCLLAMKGALLASLDHARVFPVLILAPVLGRCSMVWLSATSTYARAEGGTGSPYIGHIDPLTFWIATLTGGGLAYALTGIRGLAAMGSVIVFTAGFRAWGVRRIGGMTGDTLGACSELVEVVVLAVWSVHPAL